MSNPRGSDPLATLWLALSSTRTTAILAIALAIMAGIAGYVPQANHAVDLAKLDHSEDIQNLIAWGLADVFDSQWIRALAVMLLGNIVAVLVRSRGRSPSNSALSKLPASAPHAVELKAPLPERAVEALRENLRVVIGAPPVSEDVDGSQVTLAFETSKRSDLAPLLAHLGLIVLVVGAGLSAKPPKPGQSTIHAVLEVSDAQTKTTGVFDMAANEPFVFFRSPGKYIIRNFTYSRLGLGPAVMLEWMRPEGGSGERFWVFQNAPRDFDRRHRQNKLSIEARSMGVVALPGKGLASNASSSLLILGLGLLCFGAFSGNRADGRLWVQIDGEEVKLVGVPQVASDPRFASGFNRWASVAQLALRD